jgi:hypothetical protein
LSARSQDTARTAIIAARCSFRPGAAGACDPLKIEVTSSDELAKPECRPIAEFTLGEAPRLVGLGRVETDKPKGLASNPNRVTVQHHNVIPINR